MTATGVDLPKVYLMVFDFCGGEHQSAAIIPARTAVLRQLAE